MFVLASCEIRDKAVNWFFAAVEWHAPLHVNALYLGCWCSANVRPIFEIKPCSRFFGTRDTSIYAIWWFSPVRYPSAWCVYSLLGWKYRLSRAAAVCVIVLMGLASRQEAFHPPHTVRQITITSSGGIGGMHRYKKHQREHSGFSSRRMFWLLQNSHVESGELKIGCGT